jgi:hypothetical protein
MVYFLKIKPEPFTFPKQPRDMSEDIQQSQVSERSRTPPSIPATNDSSSLGGVTRSQPISSSTLQSQLVSSLPKESTLDTRVYQVNQVFKPGYSVCVLILLDFIYMMYCVSLCITVVICWLCSMLVASPYPVRTSYQQAVLSTTALLEVLQWLQHLREVKIVVHTPYNHLLE